MNSAIEFALVLLGVSIPAMVGAAFVAVHLRRRAHARRLKRHFSSKNQPGRPTQS